jgi:hypothetical protein
VVAIDVVHVQSFCTARGIRNVATMPTTNITLPAGTVPVSNDLVWMSQGSTTTVVSYGQFLSGLPGVPDIDASQMLVTPAGSTTSTTLANFAAGTLPLVGGTMTGPLTLAGDPTAALEAATKEYVDEWVATALPLAGGTMAGPLTLASAPTTPLGAATKQYSESSRELGTLEQAWPVHIFGWCNQLSTTYLRVGQFNTSVIWAAREKGRTPLRPEVLLGDLPRPTKYAPSNFLHYSPS